MKALSKAVCILSICLYISTPVAKAGVDIVTPSYHTVRLDGEVNENVRQVYGEYGSIDDILSMTDRRTALNYVMSGLGDEIESIASSVEREPRCDYIQFSPNASRRFVYHTPIDGVRVRWDRLYRDVDYLITHGEGTVRVWYESVRAERKYVDGIGRYTTLRGSYTTYYNSDNTPRVHNIRLASESISGTIVGDGERFSFNSVVGKRTKDRGYMDAPVVVKGKLVDGVGGGVCQVTTTLYNAVTLAGLRSVKKSAHSIPVTYVSPSRDVTVSEWIDYVFINDTGEDIYIECVTGRGYLRVNIYGLYTDEDIDIESEHEDIDGYRYSTAYIVKRRGDIVLSREKLRTDKYLLPKVESEEKNEDG